MKSVLVGMMLAVVSVGGGRSQTPSADVQTIPIPKGMNVVNLLGFDKVMFDFERAELTPPHWGFEIHSDGTGRYYEKGAPTEGNEPGNVWTDVRVSPATMAVLKRAADRNGSACETRTKHIAQTGRKVLTYWKGDVPFACTFNYSDNDAVMKAADAFQAMADTLQYGARLQHAHRFDRLGLDAEVDSLEAAVKARRSIEVQNIAPVLKSIVEDERVMERVRRKVARLLQDSVAETPPPPDSPR